MISIINYFTNASFRRTLYVSMLCLTWCIGLLTGIFFVEEISYNLFPLMRSAVSSRMSIVGLFLALIIPFLLSAFCIHFFHPLLTLIICFFKAYLFSVCAYGIVLSFANAGWLLRFLLLFSDSYANVFLLRFWIKNIAGKSSVFKADLFYYFSSSILIVCVDCLIIAPFINSLIFY